MATAEKPWMRRKGEQPNSHALFLIYRDMGPLRTLERLAGGDFEADLFLHQNSPKIPSLSALKQLSGRWEWVDRCQAWDHFIEEACNRETAKFAAKWERRRQQELEDGYMLGQALRERAKAMLRYPMTRQKVEDGGKTTIIEPARWSARDIVAMAGLSVELIAAACAATAKDPGQMSDAELDGVIGEFDMRKELGQKYR